MSKPYGLIKPNQGAKSDSVLKKPSIFDSDSDLETPSASKPTGLQKKLKKQDQIDRKRAIEEDPTVYQYDEIYDEMDKKRKESKLSRKDLDRKPKYISRLMAAADKRKRENERRIERQVQKEREAEGNEFAGKESFVTSAYKKKLEEMREFDEQDRREEYLEAIGDVKKQGNLDGFYRHLYDQKVNYEDREEPTIKKEPENEEISKKVPSGSKDSNNEEEENKIERKKRSYRKRDEDSEESQDTIKLEHLPSNIDADSDFSIDSSDEESDKKEEEKPKKVEEITKPEEPKKEIEKIEDKPIEEVKETKPKIDIWKKRTVGEVFEAALQRYYERKAVREAGK